MTRRAECSMCGEELEIDAESGLVIQRHECQLFSAGGDARIEALVWFWMDNLDEWCWTARRYADDIAERGDESDIGTEYEYVMQVAKEMTAASPPLRWS